MTETTGSVHALHAPLEAILRRQLPDVAPDEQLSSTDRLADLGADSQALIEMIMVLETEFSVIFTDEVITPETFETVGSLCAVLEQLRTTN